MNLLMTAWVVAYLPTPRHVAMLCSSGRVGYTAYRESLTAAYPPNRATYIVSNTQDPLLLFSSRTPLPAPSSQHGVEAGILLKAGADDDSDIVANVTSTSTLADEGKAADEEGGHCCFICSTSLPESVTQGLAEWITSRASNNPLSLYVAANLANIPKSLFQGGVYLHANHLDLTDVVNVRSVSEGFLGLMGDNLKSVALPQIHANNNNSTITNINTVVLPNRFMMEGYALESINLSPFQDVTSIDSSFMENCTALSTIDLSPLTKLTSVSTNFLTCCSGLKSLDLTPLRNITTVPVSFLRNCRGLKELDLVPLRHVTSISPYFLAGCAGLEALLLPPMPALTVIQEGFLMGCTGLQEIDATHLLTNVTAIHSWFLAQCTGLTRIELGPCAQLRRIEGLFLEGCSRLLSSDVHLHALGNLTAIPSSFMSRCSSLTTLSLQPLQHVTHIDMMFLDSCTGLTSIDLSPLSQVIRIEGAFLVGCTGLTSINLSPLSQLQVISDSFLQGCTGLTSIDLSPLSNVHTIGRDFMSHCSGLTTLDLGPLCNVTELQKNFLKGCSGIQTLNLGGAFRNLTVINNAFLMGCTSLLSLDLAPLSRVTKICNSFMMGCGRLRTLDLSPLQSVVSISWGFLLQCNLRVLDTSTLRGQLQRVPEGFPESRNLAPPRTIKKEERKAKKEARAARKPTYKK